MHEYVVIYCYKQHIEFFQHSIVPVPLVAIIAGSVLAAIVIVAVLLLVWRYCGGHKKRSSSYEQIIPDQKKHPSTDSGHLLDGISR